jgi:hypothetical protein
MNPIALADEKYGIKEVRRDGLAYADFNATNRLLRLPPNIGGHFTVTYEPSSPDAVSARGAAPPSFNLRQNYPNPFNPMTKLSFAIGHSSFVSLRVFDILGRDMGTVVKERLQAGTYERTWDASGMPAGVYFYRLDATSIDNPASTSTAVRKMLLLR